MKVVSSQFSRTSQSLCSDADEAAECVRAICFVKICFKVRFLKDEIICEHSLFAQYSFYLEQSR